MLLRRVALFGQLGSLPLGGGEFCSLSRKIEGYGDPLTGYGEKRKRERGGEKGGGGKGGTTPMLLWYILDPFLPRAYFFCARARVVRGKRGATARARCSNRGRRRKHAARRRGAARHPILPRLLALHYPLRGRRSLHAARGHGAARCPGNRASEPPSNAGASVSTQRARAAPLATSGTTPLRHRLPLPWATLPPMRVPVRLPHAPRLLSFAGATRPHRLRAARGRGRGTARGCGAFIYPGCHASALMRMPLP